MGMEFIENITKLIKGLFGKKEDAPTSPSEQPTNPGTAGPTPEPQTQSPATPPSPDTGKPQQTS